MRSHAKVLSAVAALFAIFAFAGQASASVKRLHLYTISSLTDPGAVAVDQSGGDVYVVELGGEVPSSIQRFDAAGNPAPFSALNGQSKINGSDVGPDADQTPANGFALDAGSQVAIDSSGGAADGTIYVADSNDNMVDVFASTGAYLGQLDGSATPQGAWAASSAHPCGVAVDGAGKVYVSTAFSGTISRYAPGGAPTGEASANYEAQIDGLAGPCGLAANAAGAVYTVPSSFGGSGAVTKYAASDFGTTSPAGVAVDPGGTAVAVDPATGDVFVDQGAQVVQYDSAGTPAGPTFGSPQLVSSHGVAVASGTDRVYSSDRHEVTPPTEPASFIAGVHAFGPPVLVPDVVTGAASALLGTSATLEGTVDPDGVALTACQFEYGTTASYGKSAPCVPAAGSIATGSGPVSVEADISGLNPGEIYHFRLVAANVNGSIDGDDSTFAAASAPTAQTLFAGPVTQTTAGIAGQIDPRNQPGTTYQFEWGTEDCSANPCAPVSASPELLGFADHTSHLVTASLTGLNPGVTYHFRLLATNQSGTTFGEDHPFVSLSPPPAPNPACPNAQIRAEQSADHLADCRAWERISPQDTNGYTVGELGNRAATDSGDGVAFGIVGGSIPGATTGRPQELAAFRTSGGWSLRSLDQTMPFTTVFGGLGLPRLGGYSPDLTQSIIESNQPLAGAEIGNGTLYLRNSAGDYTVISPAGNGGFQIATDDYSHIVFTSSSIQGTEGIPGAQFNLYEWADGSVRLASVLPDPDGPGPLSGPPAPDGAFLGNPSGWDGNRHAISADGSRVIFQDKTTVGRPKNVYIRENGTSTTLVSGSQRTDCAGDPTCGGDSIPDPAPDPAGFSTRDYVDASADGSKVLFDACEKLTDDAVGAQASFYNNNCEFGDLYLYDAESGDLQVITNQDPQGTLFLGYLGASSDLGRIYFVAAGTLAPGAVRGRQNIYLYDHGDISFVAPLQDRHEVDYFSPPGGLPPGVSGRILRDLDNYTGVIFAEQQWSRRVSDSGRYLLFTSRADLTAYDNDNAASCAAHSYEDGSVSSKLPDHSCAEVYRYDADTGELACLSCPSDGSPSRGESQLTANRGGPASTVAYPRNLLEDGTAFFQTENEFTDADSNSTSDVYRVTPSGRHDLLSGGSAAGSAAFLDADADGDNVFFTTTAGLVPSDQGGLVDLYDARVGGGFPAPSPAPACEGDACLPPPVVPADATPGSSTFTGPGNIAAKKRHHKKRHHKHKRHSARHRAGSSRGGQK